MPGGGLELAAIYDKSEGESEMRAVRQITGWEVLPPTELLRRE